VKTDTEDFCRSSGSQFRITADPEIKVISENEYTGSEPERFDNF